MDVNGGRYNIMKPNIIAAGNQKVADILKEIVSEVDKRLEAEGKLPHQLLARKNK